MSLIYLASPYTSDDPIERDFRYRAARHVTERMLLRGEAVYSPIVYGHQMEYVVGINHEPWQKLNDIMLRASSQMLILGLNGWKDSSGIAAEMAFADAAKIPVDVILWRGFDANY